MLMIIVEKTFGVSVLIVTVKHQRGAERKVVGLLVKRDNAWMASMSSGFESPAVHHNRVQVRGGPPKRVYKSISSVIR